MKQLSKVRVYSCTPYFSSINECNTILFKLLYIYTHTHTLHIIL